MADFAAWSKRARVVTVITVTALVAGIVVVALLISERPSSGMDPADAAAVTTRPSFAAPAGGGSSQPLGNISTPPSAAPGSTTSGSTDGTGVVLPSQIPLSYTPAQITAGATIAADWLSGISTIRWDDNFDARAARLATYLQNPQDNDLRRWLAPGQAAVDEMTSNRTVVTAKVSLTRVVTVARSSLLFELAVTQTTATAGAKPEQATTSWIVTVVPQGQTWKVTALIGATDGDPGY